MAGKDSSSVSSGQGKVREIPDQAKIREKSGNVDSGQGKVNVSWTVVKSQGISWIWQFHKMFIKSGNFMAMAVSQSFHIRDTMFLIFIM